MNRSEITSLNACITLGLNRHYSEERICVQNLIDAITTAQLDLVRIHDIKLSAKLTPCRIVLAGQDEESASISFINYPKFPMEREAFNLGVEYIALKLMETLEQNRIVIEFADTTVMLENSEEIDPLININ